MSIDARYRIVLRCSAPRCDARRVSTLPLDGGLPHALTVARDDARRHGWTVNLDLPGAGTRCPAHGPLVPAPTGATS